MLVTKDFDEDVGTIDKKIELAEKQVLLFDYS
jgi:hypothetical protein